MNLISIRPETEKLINEFISKKSIHRSYGLVNFLLENKSIIFTNKELFNKYVTENRINKKSKSTSRIYIPENHSELHSEIKELKNELNSKNVEEIIVGFIKIYDELSDGLVKSNSKKSVEEISKEINNKQIVKQAKETIKSMNILISELEKIR